MTIVLQHQFWDLGITEHAFEVGLSFSGVPERLLIPFDALTGFFDPSVSFGLKFEIQGDAEEPIETPPAATQRPIRGAGSEPVELQPKKAPVPMTAKSAAPKVPAKAPDAEKASLRAEKPAEAAEKTKDKDEPGGSAQVVSLDSFRKKS
jgi:hypothetical protein